MICTVVYSAFAEYQLADIWVRSKDRNSVSQAADNLEKALRRDPQHQGRKGPSNWRILLIGSLKFTFEVFPDDCRVVVLSVQQRSKEK